MGLTLRAVPPRQGWRWIVQGFAAWRRRPLAFVGLFCSFMLAVLLVMALVPLLGELLGLALVPLLTLGFMVGTRSALAGGPVHVGQLVAGLRHPERSRRIAQLQLCLGYAAASVVVIALSDLADGGALEAMMRALSEVRPGQTPPAELEAALADPRLVAGGLVRLGLTLAVSVPFWYAPALVHYAGQGALQALFSSTLALWRARAAWLVFGLGWAGLLLAVAPVLMLLLGAAGSPRLAGLMTMPLALVATTVFYVALWFGFVDTFQADAETGAALDDGDGGRPDRTDGTSGTDGTNPTDRTP